MNVYMAEEVAPGKWRMVRFERNGEDRERPVVYPLCGHKHASPDEARMCSAVQDQIPPTFSHWYRKSGRKP